MFIAERWPEAPEFAITFGLFVWIVMGSQWFIAHNGWDLAKLLYLADTHWKGALILIGLLFHRTVRDLLSHLREALGFKFYRRQMKPSGTRRLFKPGS